MTQSYKILVVEDSPTQALALAHILETWGWTPLVAQDGEEALNILATVTVDAVIVDYNLPNLRGDAFCRRVRMNIQTRDLTMIMLTSDRAAELSSIDAGADLYMSKPLDEELLGVRLRALLSKRSPNSGQIVIEGVSIRRPRILAVDDSDTFRAYLVALLSEEGYEVSEAINGEQALEMMKNQNFDGVVLDLVMPGMDGIEVCSHLSKLQRSSPDLVVMLLLTSHENKEEMTRGLAAGADDFVGKSSDVSILKARIRALLRRKFLQEENRRIVEELKNKELDALRVRAEQEVAKAKFALIDKLERTAIELKKSNEELEIARQEATTASAAKSMFLASMSHEIRTPMNGVIGMTSLLLTTQLTDEQRPYVETIRSSGQHLLGIINDILDFSKIEAGKLDLENIPFSLQALVEDVLHLFLSTCVDKGLTLAVAVHPQVMGTFIGDPGRLKQILVNLINNAIKFTESGVVALRVEPSVLGGEKPEVRFEVVDTGIGIAPEGLKRLFQSFSQTDSSITRRYGGTGLGLAIAKGLTEMMHGKIGVSSRVGEGTSFFFTAEFALSQIVTAKVPYALNGARILLAGGHLKAQEILREQLTWWGANVAAVATVEECQVKVREAAASGQDISAVILDPPATTPIQSMLDGFAATEIKLVILSTTMPHRTIPASSHADLHFLNKPANVDILFQILSGDPGAIDRPEPKHILPILAATEKKSQLILVAEDNAVNQRIIIRMLEKIGYEADVAANGREAVEALRRGNYSMVLMDCQMPVMDGYQATREIRAAETFGSRLPIIALTAGAFQEDRDNCIAAGMDEFITKPVSIEQINAVVEKYLHRDEHAVKQGNAA